MRDALIADEVQVPITSETDIVAVRQSGRDLAEHYGLHAIDLVSVATAVSELARNIVRYAARGVIVLRLVDDYDKRGVEVQAADDGPGIRDVALAMRDGFSTSGSLGLGLPGVRRLMDEFEIRSEFGKGTTVTARKWIGLGWRPLELDDWFARFKRAWAKGAWRSRG
jgi:serine/threonine-protein kinase RsbT